ncbi:MAG: hypothetical protein KIS67_24530 [Verrucomicrobiae bacterium]|nr:hypothetical protein [Verrucomicrobiae bacterium]
MNKLRSAWPGILLAVITPSLAFLCHHLAANRSGGQVRQMVEELGSILVFAGRPLPNHAGTKLVFIQYRTNDAWGIYVQEMAHGKRKLLDVLLTDTWREGVRPGTGPVCHRRK